MSRRSKAREVVIQMLFQNDLNPEVDGPSVRGMIAEQLKDPKLEDFAWKLYVGTLEFRGMLDEKISLVAQNWALARMAATDRNVLRLGAFELLQTDTPHRIVIDEALELAKTFGSVQSSQFVNGILDKLVPEDKRLADQRTQRLTRPPSRVRQVSLARRSFEASGVAEAPRFCVGQFFKLSFLAWP